MPAALFMMASKAIIANNAMQGKSPTKILEDTNAAICANHQEEMVVHKLIAEDVLEIFEKLYDEGYPIERSFF